MHERLVLRPAVDLDLTAWDISAVGTADDGSPRILANRGPEHGNHHSPVRGRQVNAIYLGLPEGKRSMKQYT